MAECTIIGCGSPFYAKGFCNAHYHRLKKFGDPLGKATCPTPQERFWPRVDRRGPDECWPWMWSCFKDGYGQFVIAGRKKSRAPRVAWMFTHGEIPDGLHVLHTCDNRKCCNPDHLYLGTNADNIADKVARGRVVLPPTTAGEANGSAKLTHRQVNEVRRRVAGGELQRVVAESLGVSQQTVSKIVRGQRWSLALADALDAGRGDV